VTAAIVRSGSPVTLVGGGALGARDLDESLALAPRLVAADGGGDLALAQGRRPEAVIGDLDSLTGAGRAALAGRLHRIEEQETTDFDKALRSVRAPLVLAVGMTGGRFDHHLAALHVLLRRPERRCVVIGPESVVCLAPPSIDLPTQPGTAVSLFPMGEVAGRSEGLAWPLDGIAFSPARRIATSNAALGPVRLSMEAPLMLLILPRSELAILAAGLISAGPGWPAP